jgi:uracil-DNA glycosylase
MDKPNSHKHLKWDIFTDAVIQKISDEKRACCFLTLGAFRQKKGSKIDRTKHLALESGHQWPMSVNQGKWFGNKHFIKSNFYLDENGIEPIEWNYKSSE